MAHLVSRIVQLNPSSDSTLNTENATSYSLCCAVCAAITRQLTFLTTGNPIVGVPPNIEASEYAKEAIRARNLYDYRLEPSHDNLLISFFLYIYYVNIKGGIQAAVLYMKEAISIAQLLGLHDPRTYASKTTAEVHRLRKIYYMLLVTERFMCIEDNIPVCLEPSIPLPSLEDEEYSGLLTGFIELVKIFSIPDKKFFDNLINYSKKNPSNLQNFHNLFASSGAPTQKWIISVQTELKKIEIENASSDTQRLNIILSKHWMRSLAWHISSQNGLLIKKPKTSDESCLTTQFPIEIAKDFLISTENLPIFSFESNGPGVCVKLLEIALAVADSVNECIVNKVESFTAYNILTSVFNLVSKFKSDITISQELYSKVESIVNKKSVPSPVYPKSYIREINDDGESIHSDESSKANSVDPLNGQNSSRNQYQDGQSRNQNQHQDQTQNEPQPASLESFHDKDLIQSEFKYFDPSVHIPSLIHSPNNQSPQNSPFTQMTMAFSLSPSHQMNFDQDYLGLYNKNTMGQPHGTLGQVPAPNQRPPQQNQQQTGNQSQGPNQLSQNQLFQTFHQTLSPSAEQLQQLELQLQHQFNQFHQNQYKQYQYGSPSPNEAGPGRGNATGLPDNFRIKSPDTLLNEANMNIKGNGGQAKSDKKKSDQSKVSDSQTPSTSNSETVSSDATISKSNSKSDSDCSGNNKRGSIDDNGRRSDSYRTNNSNTYGRHSNTSTGTGFAGGGPTSTSLPIDNQSNTPDFSPNKKGSSIDKQTPTKHSPTQSKWAKHNEHGRHSPHTKEKYGSPLYSEVSSYASTYSDDINFNEQVNHYNFQNV